jgi:hypothetical protein
MDNIEYCQCSSNVDIGSQTSITYSSTIYPQQQKTCPYCDPQPRCPCCGRLLYYPYWKYYYPPIPTYPYPPYPYYVDNNIPYTLCNSVSV